MSAAASFRSALRSGWPRVPPSVLLLTVFLGATSPGSAQGPAQDPAQEPTQDPTPGLTGAEASRSGDQDALGPVKVDPTTGRRYREVRPNAGIRRGAFPVPRWVPAVVGATITLLALMTLIAAHRRQSRR